MDKIPTSRAYIFVENGKICRIEGEYSLPQNLEGWILLEEGAPCDRLNHAQGHYFEKPLINMDGTHNYYYENGSWREATAEELAAEAESLAEPEEPSDLERIEAQVMFTALMTDSLLEE